MAALRSDDRLQQYFDGELDAEQAGALRRELDDDPALRAKLEGLAHLHTLLASAAEAQADELDSDALFGRITAALEQPAADDGAAAERADPGATARPVLGVIRGGKPEHGKKEPRSAERSNVVWIGAAIVAIAAAVLLVVLGPFDLGSTPDGDGGVASAPRPGSEVVEVDFGYSTGAIFSVEGQEGERYAVVWISDDKPIPDDDESTERIQ